MPASRKLGADDAREIASKASKVIVSKGKKVTEFKPGDRANFAIRPEKIAISRDEPTDRRNRVRGSILDIGYLGNLSTYHVKLPEGPVIKCEAANSRRIQRRDFTWNDEVWLSWTDTAGLVLAD